MKSTPSTRRPIRLKKLPSRFGSLVTPLVLSLLMTCVVSLIATLRALGFSERLFGAWLDAWGLSWLVAFPVLLFVLPLVRRVVVLFVESPN
jgi:hypothetical protein